MKWIKKGKYYEIFNGYTMSWNDPKDRYTLYYNKEHLKSGSRDECMAEFWIHFKKDKK